MVNEGHKPPGIEDAALRDRLAASNQQLAAMQEEHRQLMQEMDALRQRAAELTSLNARNEESADVSISSLPPIPIVTALQQSERDQQRSSSTQSNVQPIVGEEDEPNDESIDYIRQKMEEIATLKAQYRRVQNMINTTNLIEQKLSQTSENTITTSNVIPSQTQTQPITTTTIAPSEPSSDLGRGSSFSHVEPLIALPTVAPEELAAAIHSGNEELLSTMVAMFTDFTSDLRSQADSLRSERERIRQLKEELLKRRKQT